MSTVERNSLRAWVLAARPKTLTAALVPVGTATALAYHDGQMEWLPALLCALFAALMQIASNLINDLFDFLKGTDNEARLGPKRACAQGWISPRAMRRGIGVCILAACLVGLCLLQWGGWGLIILGGVCVVAAFLYTLALSYWGWGDVMVLVFFGFVPVLGTYYVQAGGLSASAWWLGAGCGFAIDTLLVVNNYRDRATDRAAGKQTLIARFGERFGRYLYGATGVLGCACAAPFVIERPLVFSLLLLPYLFLHQSAYHRMVMLRDQGAALNEVLGLSARNIFIYGLSLSAAFVLTA